MSTADRWLLPLAVLIELIAIGFSSIQLGAIAGVLFIFCFLWAGGRLQGYSRVLLLISLAVTAWLFVRGQLGIDKLVKASADAAFYAAFLGSLGMMQCLVRRFEVLRRIHDVLLGGRTLWLYPKYAVVSCGIASVLSFGMMNLLCGSLSDTLRERGITGESRLQWLRSVLISALRGFALVPLVAPTSVAVAILTKELPELTWLMLLPYGLAASVVLIGVGWFLEQRRFRQVSSERVALERWPAGTLQLLGLVATVFFIMAMIVALTDFKVSVAAMMTVPSVTLLYMMWQERSLGVVLKEGVTQVSAMNNEMAIFAASAILGVSVSSVIPADALSGLATSSGGMWVLAVVGMLSLPLLSTIGIIPITVLSVQAGLLPQLMAEGMDPILISVALVIGFSLAMMLSPFGPSVMLLARFGQVPRWVVAFRWNGVFVLIAVPLLLALLALEMLVLPGVSGS
ncbi:hypothetical protein [Marinobacter sp. S6332]|uniref:hypothetical protein n=1 Tax=Marinobacter sp. S6332 TaxID=2926403 RepID=UPI001FF5F0F3|nr:hypothetical protein [Marinobacter sp. S6332]MCK0162369.1 hypothetical protein [Marinobacter sp. S6332]